MNTVIGPFTKEDWDTLIFLKRDIKKMKSLNKSIYLKAIDKETYIYNNILREYLVA